VIELVLDVSNLDLSLRRVRVRRRRRRRARPSGVRVRRRCRPLRDGLGSSTCSECNLASKEVPKTTKSLTDRLLHLVHELVNVVAMVVVVLLDAFGEVAVLTLHRPDAMIQRELQLLDVLCDRLEHVRYEVTQVVRVLQDVRELMLELAPVRTNVLVKFVTKLYAYPHKLIRTP
jgi:hypothetical protein